MKLAVEHEEASLHLLTEVRALTQHKRGEPSAYVSVGGSYQGARAAEGRVGGGLPRAREPLAKDAGLLATARMQFQSFVGRLEAALHAALPEGGSKKSVPRRWSCARRRSPPRRTRDPRSPIYDPYAVYYPVSPLGVMLDVMLISSFMSHDDAAAFDHDCAPAGGADWHRRHHQATIPIGRGVGRCSGRHGLVARR